MKTQRYTGDYTEGFLFDKPNQRIEFTRGSEVYDPTVAISIGPAARGTELVVAGTVTAGNWGIHGAANGAAITIEDSGSVGSNIGLWLTGAKPSLENFGEITGLTYGILSEGASADLRNEGLISAPVGVSIFGDGGTRLINGRDGEVAGIDAGVIFSTAAGTVNELVNRGALTSEYLAVVGGNGDDRVVNRGHIEGDVLLGNGYDEFDGRDGSVSGTVSGQQSNDLYIVSDDRLKLVESANEGFDSIRSSIDYRLPDNFEVLYLMGSRPLEGHGNALNNYLTGNRGDNALYGLDGTDVLGGGAGLDVIFGGAGEDRFYFETGYGTDIIEDFEPGLEQIYLYNWDRFQDADELLDHARNVNGNATISAGSDVLIIVGVPKQLLSATDFEFDV